MSNRASASKLKVMVASTVYGFTDQLDQICATFQGYKYDVWNSYFKTIPVHPGLSNTDNCLQAVESCDVFFGIVRPQYGAVLNGEHSITHQEMLKAIELKKPRWFIAHRDISIARQLLKPFMWNADGTVNTAFQYQKNKVMDDIRVIHLYNDTILHDFPPQDRVGHWIDEYFKLSDILKCIETQFADRTRVRDIVEQMKGQAP